MFSVIFNSVSHVVGGKMADGSPDDKLLQLLMDLILLRFLYSYSLNPILQEKREGYDFSNIALPPPHWEL